MLQGQAFTVIASGFLGDVPSFGLYVAMADGVVFPLSFYTCIVVPVFEDVAVFPNPAAEQVQIRFKSQTTKPGTSRIYDMTGRPVLSIPIMLQEGENLLYFPVQQLSRGQYILELMQDDGTSMRFPVIKN